MIFMSCPNYDSCDFYELYEVMEPTNRERGVGALSSLIFKHSPSHFNILPPRGVPGFDNIIKIIKIIKIIVQTIIKITKIIVQTITKIIVQTITKIKQIIVQTT